MRRTRFALLSISLLVAGAAEAAKVVDVRVGVQSGDKTRIVLELDAPARYTISQQEIPSASGTVTELMVDLEATGSFAAAGQPGLVDSVRIKSQGEGSVALIRLKTASPRITDMALDNPHRIVIDVARGGATAAPKPAAAAKPTSPPPARPEAPAPAKSEPAAPAEPPAARPPSTIVGTAPPAAALGSAPTSVVAKAEPVEPTAPPAVEAPPEPPATGEPGPAAAPAPAEPAAQAPTPAEPPAGAAAPAPPAPEPSPAAPPAAAPPAPPREPAREREPAAQAPPAKPPVTETPLGPVDQLREVLRSDPRLVAIGGAVLLLFVIWRLLARRSRAAARSRRRVDFPPLPPIEGLAPALEDEPGIVGRVREEPATPVEEDELPALKTTKRVGWREPLPGAAAHAHEPAAPVVAPAEPKPRPAPAAGPEVPTPPPVEPAVAPPPIPAFERSGWQEREPDLLASPGEPEQPTLWGESEPGELPEIEPPSALEPHPADLELPPPAPPSQPAPAPAATGELEREMRELERRLRHLETRLEEATEARDRLERQLAANSEELRVQRSAIARTQRVVRTLVQPEGQAKDPSRGPGG
jgi:hypothetical protein